MLINLLKSKIHLATATEANLNYVGSISIDKTLMDAANICEFETTDGNHQLTVLIYPNYNVHRQG